MRWCRVWFLQIDRVSVYANVQTKVLTILDCLILQGKDGIPLQQQRLTFKVANQEEEESSSQRPKNSIFEDSYKGRAAADLIKDLQTWKALLRCNNVIVGKLENPVVSFSSPNVTLLALISFFNT